MALTGNVGQQLIDKRLCLLEIALEADNYRALISRAIEVSQRQYKSAYSYSALSQKAGFKSRSFIREVLDHKKNMSPVSLEKLCDILGYKSSVKQLALLLLQEELGPTSETLKIKLKITRLKKRIASDKQRYQFQKSFPVTNEFVFFGQPELMYVYSALGSQENGANLDEIANKTNLNQNLCLANLEILLKNDFIEKRHDRYFAVLNHLVLSKLGKSVDFKNIFLRSLKDLQKNAYRNFDSGDDLFFHSAFSVSADNLAALKEKLRQTVVDFIDDQMDDEGGQIIKLTVGLYSNQ
jgi:uncharacterized protein (TIGR02147 family)